MVTSSAIGANKIYEVLKRVKDNPTPTTQAFKSSGVFPAPRTPLNQNRFTGGLVNGNNSRQQFSGRPNAKATVKLLVGEPNSADPSSPEGVTAGLADMD